MADEPRTSGIEGLLGSIAQPGNPWYDSIAFGKQFADELLATHEELRVGAVGVRGFASITEPVRRWTNTVSFSMEPESVAAPEPDVAARLLDAHLEQFAEDVARGIVGQPRDRHAIILSRQGSHHVLAEAIWRHVDRLRNEEND
jgi:hypothetical protein